MNSQERWSDYRFSELEAEVEAEGRLKSSWYFPFHKGNQSGIRRESSLSKALAKSDEAFILLEGDPGSGKSITLRHLCLSLAHNASMHPRIKSTIPLYINLKDLKRLPGQNVDSQLIRSFVMSSINRMNDRDLDVFLEEEFDRGLKEGTWLFLFDSFDEIPEILGTTSSEEISKSYAEGISFFLSTMNTCRGIIASRQFHGPDLLRWPHFRIKDLSEKRRLKLIHTADLPTDVELKLIRDLMGSAPEIRNMTRNPMFLGLLCDQVRSGGGFPQYAHQMLESHVVSRLTHDELRLQKRFCVQSQDIRNTAETIAFCMGKDLTLGLNPTRSELREAFDRNSLPINDAFDIHCDALEYIKLARSNTNVQISGDAKTFTFSHRRFQEYFATCMVIRNFSSITPNILLTDGRWRETAVTLLQTQPQDVVTPILDEAFKLLDKSLTGIQLLEGDPEKHLGANQYHNDPKPFPWPTLVQPILDILQQGYARDAEALPENLRNTISRITVSATLCGSLTDRKWALEVAGVAPFPIIQGLLRHAFSSNSRWLRDVAYRQVSRLPKISDDIAKNIRGQLVNSALEGLLRKERQETEAFIARLDRAQSFIRVINLLEWTPYITVIIGLVAIVLVGLTLKPEPNWILFLTAVTIIESALLSRGTYKIPFAKINIFSLACGIFVMLQLSKELQPYIQIYAYAFVWPFFAYQSARTGKYCHPALWIFLPVIWIVYILFHISPTIRSFINVFKMKTLVVSILAMVAMIAILVYLLNLHNDIVNIVLLIIGGLLVLLTIILMSGDLVNLALDSVRWFSFRRKNHSSMSLGDLLNQISLYKQNSFAPLLVRFVREHGLLNSNHDIRAQLQDLAIAVEYETRKKEGVPDYSGNFVLINEWIVKCNNHDKLRIHKLGSEFLDEVCILRDGMSSAHYPPLSTERK